MLKKWKIIKSCLLEGTAITNPVLNSMEWRQGYHLMYGNSSDIITEQLIFGFHNYSDNIFRYIYSNDFHKIFYLLNRHFSRWRIYLIEWVCRMYFHTSWRKNWFSHRKHTTKNYVWNLSFFMYFINSSEDNSIKIRVIWEEESCPDYFLKSSPRLEVTLEVAAFSMTPILIFGLND